MPTEMGEYGGIASLQLGRGDGRILVLYMWNLNIFKWKCLEDRQNFRIGNDSVSYQFVILGKPTSLSLSFPTCKIGILLVI